jgi:glutamate racemase
VNPRPVGVFDSGIGGLTVVRELLHQLPHEHLLYVGDTARVPYGNKSPETVRRYSREILRWLLERDVKMVVVACNTASAHALDELRRLAPVPVEGVVGPGARAAVAASRTGHIGVIGTAGTVRSGAYERAIGALAPEARVVQQACPLFVPLVEEGWLDRPATRLIAEEYLAPLVAQRVDALVLGCTHYPLLKPLLREVLGTGIALIDSAEETARAVGTELAESGLEGDRAATASAEFYATDAPDQFERVGLGFLGERVRGVRVATVGEE